MPGRYAVTMVLVLSLSSCDNDSFSEDRSLFYQGWAQGGNYEVVERFPCVQSKAETIDCSITVKDDLMGALGIDFEGFVDGGPTPGDCVRAMVRGYAESASRSSESDGSRTPA